MQDYATVLVYDCNEYLDIKYCEKSFFLNYTETEHLSKHIITLKHFYFRLYTEIIHVSVHVWCTEKHSHFTRALLINDYSNRVIMLLKLAADAPVKSCIIVILLFYLSTTLLSN